ncbi:PEP-CTERM system TPR-repeat protein PrsT [Salinimonas sp. HHU 13199]|uniref:PEP-CTERM system TPR-repeat protein PrsT n=1 Tax=Salinimonas profundi TaxID=2729140 RepID=A0ABR8LMD0_9ALTE|nr:XrtA/PEP-CTERM system TPR-repeat protein PrsT [Salinimonas profundi]MBD3587354.1 PEP-CTERM system TPR-repeat protein PrsT [Salinimonas profundi]
MKSSVKASILSMLLLGGSIANATPQSASYDKALTAFNTGEVQSAYLTLKHVLKAAPDHLPAKLLMGRILLLDGYTKEAIEEFEEVLLAGGDKNLVLPALSRAYLREGLYEKIFVMLKRHKLSGDAEISVTLAAGTAYIRLNQLDKARSLYTQALRTYPHVVPLLNAQANLLLDQNELAAAHKLVRRSLSISDSEPLTLITQAKLYAAQGKDALSLFAKAYEQAPENPAAMRAYAGALAENGQFDEASTIIDEIEKQTPGDIQNQLIKARILALTQHHSEADKILKSLTDKLSLLTEKQLNERIELSLIAGIVAYLNKNYSLASTELYRYVGKRDASPEQLSMLADAMIKNSNYKDASNLLDKYEETVISHLPLARLYCELNLAMDKPFKCNQILPALAARYKGQENFAILKVKLLLHDKELDQARKMLATELAGSDNEEVVRLNIALFSEQEEYAKALGLAKSLLQKHPESLAHQALVSDLLIRNNSMDEADKAVDKLLRADPDNVAGLIAKARISLFKEDWSSSTEAIEQAVKIDKTNVPARILAAQIYIAHDNIESATDHLLAAKTLESRNPTPRQLLASLYSRQGKLNAALSEINALLSIDRLSPDFHLQKASVLNEMGKVNEAQSQLNMVYALWAQQPEKLLQLAEQQEQAGDAPGAEKSLQQAMKLAPKAPRPHLEYISFLIRQNHLEQAQPAITEFANQFGKTANLAMLRGDLAVADNQLQQGFSHYMTALDRAPSFRMALIKAFELARTGTGRGELIEYLTAFEESGDTFQRHLLADLYYIDTDFTRAEKVYNQLLSDDEFENRPFVLNNLANIYAVNDLPKALKLIDTALEKAPRSAALMDTKGWLLSLGEDYQEGLSLLRQAYTLDASDPSVQYHIAYTLNKLGRPEEARAILTKHQTLDKSFREQPDAQALMQSL